MYLQDFFNYLESSGQSDSPILSCKEMLWKKFHFFKKCISKDEFEDLQTDIIIIALEAEEHYNPMYGASFSTYLCSRLAGLSNGFLTRYTGVKITSQMIQAVFKGQKIYINKTEYKED